MGREAVEREMNELTGTVLSTLDRVPDELVDAEWRLLKQSVFDDTLIPNRYKALIGVAVAATLRCPYGTRLHTEMARLNGASEAELAEATQQAVVVSGWSIRMAAQQVDAEEFTAELAQVVQHVATRISVDV